MSGTCLVHPLCRVASRQEETNVSEALSKAFEYDPSTQTARPWTGAEHHLDPLYEDGESADILVQSGTTGAGNGQSGVDPQ